MIDTEIKSKPLRLEDPIKLIDIDFTNFLTNNRPILSQFVDKATVTTVGFLLAINQAGKVQVISDNSYFYNNFIKLNKVYGIHSGSIYLIEKLKMYSIDSQIVKILTAYQAFLQMSLQEERRMNFFELRELDSTDALFTEKAYIRYAIPRIMTGDIGVLDAVSDGDATIINNFDFFAKLSLIQPGFIASLANTKIRDCFNVLCSQYLQSHNTTTPAISVLTEKVTTFE